MKPKNATGVTQHKRVKTLLAGAALGTLGTGFVLYMFAGDLGFPGDTTELIAIVFLAVGVMDFFLLLMWDRIFMRATRSR